MRLLAVFLIALAGLLLRLDAAWDGAEENLPDSAAYERIARGLHEEGRFAQVGPGTPAHPQPATNYSPGLPLAVAGLFELAGDDDVRLARILLALITSLSIPLAWMLARRLAPPGEAEAAGLVAAVVVAFYPCLIADAGMLLTESLAGTLIVASLLLVLRARDRTNEADTGRGALALAWFLPGLTLGLTAMVRPEYLPISLLLVAVIVALNRPAGTRRALLAAAATVLAIALVVAPWTARNLDETGRLLPLSTGGGQTLFTGSYLPSAGDPLQVMPLLLERHPSVAAEIEAQNRASGEGADSITPERVLTLLAADRMPGVPTDVALTRLGRRNYERALREDPAGLAEYLAGKAARIWWRGRTDLTGTPAGRALHMTLVALALGGLLLLAARRRPEFWLILALAVGATIVGTILVASPRRTLVLWPVIASLGGIGAAGALRLALDAWTGRPRPVRIA